MRKISNSAQTRYVVITPARDEARYLPETIRSVAGQTLRPTEWVIVDDGSTDETGEIIDRAAAQHEWITAVHRNDRGMRENNTGAVEAFCDGHRALKIDDWDFLVNLDGDLSLREDYFERCIDEFLRDPKLGIGGGTLYHFEKGVSTLETCPLFHVRGATKIYRRTCWNAIGGLPANPGWDTIDELKANMLGWKTRSFPKIQARHCRSTGAAHGVWRDAVKNGQAEYFSGYHPLFMLTKCLRRLIQQGSIVGSAGLVYGFAAAYINKRPIVNDEDLVSYVRKQQIRRLLLLDSIWK